MPYNNQESLQRVYEILIRIKRYYASTQNEFYHTTPNISANWTMLLQTSRDLKKKLDIFEQEKQTYIKCIQLEKDSYLSFHENNRFSLNILEAGEIAAHLYPLISKAASDLYCNLMMLHRSLSQLLPSELEEIKIFISVALDISSQFEASLNHLSDYIFEQEVSSSAFSLARHMELLPILYQQSYETEYDRYGFFSFGILHAYKTFCRPAVRKDEIEFLSGPFTKHPQCNDHMRVVASVVLIMKINESKGYYSLLKELLRKGVMCSTTNLAYGDTVFELLNDFCHEHQIFMPDNLLCYLNNKINNPESNGLLF